MARPTKLTKNLLKTAADYLERTTPKKAIGKDFDGEIPTVEGLALDMGINRSTVYEWAKGAPEDMDKKAKAAQYLNEFSNILDKIKMNQAKLLIDGGIKGHFNAPITKMMLSKHGYIEESTVNQNIKGDVAFVNDVPRPKRNDNAD